MLKLVFLGILIVTGLVMISTSFTTTQIIAQSDTTNTNMTDTDNINMTDTDNTNMPEADKYQRENNLVSINEFSKIYLYFFL